MKNEEKIFMAILLIIMLVMVFMAFKYSTGARVLPLLSGIAAAAMMGVIVLMAFSSRMASWYEKFEAKDILSKVMMSRDEKKREISVVAWFTGCTFIIYLLGFMVGIPVFLFLFLKIWGKESWVLSLVTAVVVLGVIYFSFVDILNVPLHKGIFLE